MWICSIKKCNEFIKTKNFSNVGSDTADSAREMEAFHVPQNICDVEEELLSNNMRLQKGGRGCFNKLKSAFGY